MQMVQLSVRDMLLILLGQKISKVGKEQGVIHTQTKSVSKPRLGHQGSMRITSAAWVDLRF